MYEPWDDVSDLANANVDLEITGGTFINENAEGRAFVQPEFLDIPVTYRNIVGGTYSSDVREYIAESVVSKMINNMYVVGKENDIKVEEPTLGKVSVDKTNAIVGETITVIATPNNGYEVANIKVLDAKGEEITVTNNKFVMPDGGVTVEAEFTRLIKTDDIPVVDFTEEVKEVTIGVKDKETVQEILYETIINDETLFEKIELERVNVEIEIDQIESSKISEETVKKMEEKAGKATIANYFDISIAVKNTSGTINEQINELTKEIELMIALPEELRNNNNDINRKYYVVREHVVDSESQVDLLEAKLSADGKHLTFKTDKFSTYALAYEDVKKANNPDTSDNINLYVTLGVISLMGVGISANVLKKRYLKK